VTTDDGVERLLSANVSSDALRLVGAQPLLGRLFSAAEDKLGSMPVVMLSEGTWRNKFSADPHIIGRVIKVDGAPATVVGVMPASFRFPNDQEMWESLGFSPFEPNRETPVIDVIGRLKPGVSPERAAEDLRQITARRGSATLAARDELRPVVTPFREYYLTPELHRSALVLFALSLVFVLVSCVNAANLVMIDFFGRSAEIASSLALGIPRAAAIRGICFQLLITAGLAAAVGTELLMWAAPHIHQAVAVSNAPYWLEFSLRWHHVAVALTLAAVSAGVALVVPLGYLFLVSPDQLIRAGAGSSRGTARGVGRRAAMMGPIALLTVLALSAGLLLRSSRNLAEERWGYDPHTIFNGKTAMKESEFASSDQRLAVQLRLVDELDRVPGIVGAAVMSSPIGYSTAPNLFYALARDGLSEGQSQGGAQGAVVSPEIFTVLGVPFVEGETFSRSEKKDGPTYVVINHSLAERLWPRQAAVGRTFFTRSADPREAPVQVVVRGVVRDFQAAGPKAAVNDAVYRSIMKFCPGYLFLNVRGERAPPTMETITQAARRVDPRLPVYLPNTLQRVIDKELGSIRLTMQLTLLYALSAVLLCAIGVYSVTVSQIMQRNREFGIRLALGIEPSRLWLRFVRSHLAVVGGGIFLGLVAMMAVVPILEAILFGVKGRDPFTFGCVTLLILVVAALACIPSRFRLLRINPAQCLRSL
jgi:predicted permease